MQVTLTRNHPPIHLGSPGEDISKKDLHSIIQRFKNLNQLRQQRIQGVLQSRQQTFLHILPLIFHRNHPLLPGFISSETPAGIPDYTPNKQSINAAKQFSKSFTYKRRALLRHPIQGIFLMGSVSSIVFSKASDMDIWLCHQPDLSPPEIKELQQKATAIEKWGESLELEIHFFLIDSTLLSKGQNAPISSESSGSTQHYLLLEEFYRTAIFIAGRIPAWWLVPPHQENNYTPYLKHLLDHRFIDENEIIDFGGLESIPAEEFISGALWHIYKSISSPHKSLLKLFLMESYASEYPSPKWLCVDLKNEIYQGSMDIEHLDPYLLIYAKVEDYLQKSGSSQQINLARQCFYLKIMGPSYKTLDTQSQTLKSNYMQSIAKQWNWPKNLLDTFHKQKYWDIKKATQEHIIIRTQLKHSLRTVLQLAGDYVKHNYRENNELKLISRKLYAFLEKKPRKVEIITTRTTVHAKEDALSIIESQGKNNTSIWTLYAGELTLEEEPSTSNLIKKDTHLLNLLGWLVVNGLYHKQLQLYFKSPNILLSNIELHQLLTQLFQLFSKNLQENSLPLPTYNKADSQLASLIIINLGQTLVNERKDGMLVLSERSDPLSYGKKRQCFIQKIDQISVSSWGEITTSKHQGLDGFFDSLVYIFNHTKQPISIRRFKVICYTPTRANSITLRTNTIFSNLITFFSKQPKLQSNRYFLAGESSFYVFQRNNKHLRYWSIDSEDQLLQELAATQEYFGQVYFDPGTLDNSAIPFLYQLNQANCIQIFYLSENDCITVFIIDEKGTLFTQEHIHSNCNQILNNYFTFLEPILNHPYYVNDLQLKYYEIIKQTTSTFTICPAKWTPPPYIDLSLRVIIEESPDRSISANYHIYCNDQEFNTATYGNQLFKEVSDFVMSNRKGNNNYPIHITHLEAPCYYLGVDNEDQLQTAHHLNYKKKIEAKLNT